MRRAKGCRGSPACCLKPTAMRASQNISRLINSHRSWSHGLEAALTPLSANLSKTTFIEALHLIKSPAKSLLFFKWAHTRLHFPHLPETYSAMIGILSRARSVNAARNFLLSIPKFSCGAIALQDRYFNALIRGYGSAGLISESIKLFKSMSALGVLPSVYSFNSLLSVLLHRGRTNMAKELFHEMCDTPDVVPDLCTFNTLIRGFCLNSMVDEGFWFFKEMSRFRCAPDVITYNTLVDGLCRAGKVKIAHNLVKGMCDKNPELSPSVVTYTTLIRGFCEKQLVSDALVLFEEMVSRELKPNKVTYNTLIQGLCEARMVDKIKEILPDNGEFTPDTCTFNTLISSHCTAGNLSEALIIFDKMSKMNVDRDSATYSLLIRSLCRIGDFERAEILLDELSRKLILLRNEGCVPLVAAYNPIFEYLCRVGKTKKADKVFQQLMKRGIQDPPAFRTLIMGYCKEGTYRDAFNIMLQMLQRDFVPDAELYDHLIDGFLQSRDPIFAYKTLHKMLKSGYKPKTPVFHSILGELLREAHVHDAARFIALMLEKNVRPNINLSTEVVVVLFWRGLKDIAFEIVDRVYNNGYSIKMEEVVSFLCHKKKFLEAQRIGLFSLTKNQELDGEIYSRIIAGLCEIQKSQEAFSLFYELAERGLGPSLSCLKDLKGALETIGRLEDAKFVAKQMLRWDHTQ